MPEDNFKPGRPQIQAYVADPEGNIDFNDRDRSGAFWLKDDLTSDGRQKMSGKLKGRRVFATVSSGWKLVRVDSDDEEGAGW